MGLIVVPLLFVYASLAYFITRKLSRVPKKQFHRLLVKIVCTVLFVGLVIGDAIVGRVYLKYLCSKDGGIVINETIELGPEYFDENQRFKIDADAYFFEGMVVEDSYKVVTKKYPIRKNISQRKISIWEFPENKEIASLIDYSGGGGWFENISPGGGIGCPGYNPSDYQKIFFLKVFIQK